MTRWAAYHDHTASQTTLGTFTVRVAAEEQQSRQADFLEVQGDKDGVERLGVVHATGFERIRLISAPSEDVLVCTVHPAQGQHQSNDL